MITIITSDSEIKKIMNREGLTNSIKNMLNSNTDMMTMPFKISTGEYLIIRWFSLEGDKGFGAWICSTLMEATNTHLFLLSSFGDSVSIKMDDIQNIN